MQTKLNNKQKCRYRTLVSAKLESMGVKDEITYVESAKKFGFEYNTKTNQFEKKLFSRFRAQNVNRNMTKTLVAQGLETVQAFLALDPAKVVPKPEVPVFPQDVDGQTS